MAKLTMIQALNQALDQEMQRDKSIVVLGEDVGKDGGVFRATDGLWKKYGDERVIDTPLAESGIVGTSIGMSLMGIKPVAEIQFDGFTYPALDQIFSHAARIRPRTQGKHNVPIVIRFPYSGGIRALEHHSESPETYFAHTAGLKVVIPATPYDMKGLLISSIRDPDPVIFMEPKRIYRAFREEVPEEEYTVPIGEAKITQEGTDVTVISYGAMHKVTKDAIEKSGTKHSIELIDLRTISPIDKKTITESVKKTGRAVIVHEAPRTCGIGAEITSILVGNAFFSLEAPIARVTGMDVPYPYFKAEKYYLPDSKKIFAAIDNVMSY